MKDTIINYSTLAYYIDSVLNKGKYFPDSIKSQFYINSLQTDLHEDNRLIHFKEDPEEWYLIEFQGSPCIELGEEKGQPGQEKKTVNFLGYRKEITLFFQQLCELYIFIS